MQAKYKVIVGTVAIVVIAIGGVFFIYQYVQTRRALPEHIQKTKQIGESSKEFIVYDLNTKPLALFDFKNKITVVNFWATWCAPCVEELSSLNKIAGIFSNELVVLAVSNERTDDIKNFLTAFPGLNANFIPASVSRERMLSTFPVQALPETYILNKAGQVVEKIIGPRQWDSPKWQEKFKKLIKE